MKHFSSLCLGRFGIVILDVPMLDVSRDVSYWDYQPNFCVILYLSLRKKCDCYQSDGHVTLFLLRNAND